FRESRFLHCRLLEGSLPEISTMRWSYFRGRLHSPEIEAQQECAFDALSAKPRSSCRRFDASQTGKQAE
ncbi:hypothetical protein, partial [Desulfovibrio intestinalis]|uniref:hypothetical protein n=1 Tax=Desulfovibrio intestinalis TaxID=58621 RepID=UPI001C863E00